MAETHLPTSSTMGNAGETIGSAAEHAGEAAKTAANSDWTARLARFGYICKGLLYVLIGAIAAKAAVTTGGVPTDRKGALLTMYQQPFGKLVLAAVTVGLFGYALWNGLRAALDTDHEGKRAKGVATRIGYGVVAVSYASLAIAAFQLMRGAGSGGKSSDASTQDWTAKLLHAPFGPVWVIVVGVIVLGVAGALGYQAMSGRFERDFQLHAMSEPLRRAVAYLGRIGLIALGVVMGIIGLFLIVAAVRRDAGEARGLGGALVTLAHEPFGPALLGAVALGLLAYGLYSFLQARYRRIGKAW